MNIKEISQIKNRSAFDFFIEDSFLVEPEPDVLFEAENLQVPVEVQNVEVPIVNVIIAKVVSNIAQVANDDMIL